MKRKTSKILSLFIVLVLALTSTPTIVSAGDQVQTQEPGPDTAGSTDQSQAQDAGDRSTAGRTPGAVSQNPDIQGQDSGALRTDGRSQNPGSQSAGADQDQPQGTAQDPGARDQGADSAGADQGTNGQESGAGGANDQDPAGQGQSDQNQPSDGTGQSPSGADGQDQGQPQAGAQDQAQPQDPAGQNDQGQTAGGTNRDTAGTSQPHSGMQPAATPAAPQIATATPEVTPSASAQVHPKTDALRSGAAKTQDITVSFVSVGMPTDVKVNADGTVTPPKDPVQMLDDWNFLGWYTDDTFTTLFDFTQKITQNQTLYGRSGYGHLVQFLDQDGKLADFMIAVSPGDKKSDCSISDMLGDGKETIEEPKAGEDGVPFAYWYQDGDTGETEFDLDQVIKGNTILRPHFGEKKPEGPNVTFIVPGASDEPEVKQVDADGMVTEPANPKPDKTGLHFIGWYTSPADENSRYNFDTPITQDTTLYARFSDKLLVLFEDADGKVIDSIEVDDGGNVSERLEYGGETLAEPSPDLSGKSFAYWYKKGDASKEAFGLDTQIHDTTILAPYYTDTHTVLFISDGSQVSGDNPVYVRDGETVDRPEDSTRDGYKFAGWVDQKTGQAYDFDTPVTSDLTLTAKWTPQETTYRVAYYIEKRDIEDPGTDPDNYEFTLMSNAVTGDRSGESVTIGRMDAGRILKNSTDISYAAQKKILQTYCSFGFSDTRTLSGNQTTVINVYYTRNTYQLIFNLKQSGVNVNAAMTANGRTYETGDRYVIEAKYQQNIEKLWPGEVTVEHAGGRMHSDYNFQGWRYSDNSYTYVVHPDSEGMFTTGNPRLMTEECIDRGGDQDQPVKMTANYIQGDRENTRRIWLERSDSSRADQPDYVYQDRDYNARNFEHNEAYDQKYYTPTLEYGETKSYYADPIFGYSFEQEVQHGQYAGDYYYGRNVHNLNLILGGGEIKGAKSSGTEDDDWDIFGWGGQDLDDNTDHSKDLQIPYRFEDKIGKPEDPTRDGYVFDGWYQDNALTQEADFAGLTMQDQDIALYAKWSATDYQVSYYGDYDTYHAQKEVILTQSYGAGETADFPDTGKGAYIEGRTYVKRKGVFAGWYRQIGNESVKHSESTPINSDLSLYAKWQTEGFHITYAAGEGSGTVPVDPESYNLNTKAAVQDGSRLQPKNTDEEFIGWRSDLDGQIYYPNQHMTIKGNAVLTAEYVNPDNTVQITYHSNYPEGKQDEKTFTVLKNSKITLQDAMFTYKDADGHAYAMTGWMTESDGKEPDYEPGQTGVTVGVEDLDLYAGWERLVTLTFTVSDPVHGHLQDANGNEDPDGVITFTLPAGSTMAKENMWVPGPYATDGYRIHGWKMVNPPAGFDPDQGIIGRDRQVDADLTFEAQIGWPGSSLSISDIVNGLDKDVITSLTVRLEGTHFDEADKDLICSGSAAQLWDNPDIHNGQLQFDDKGRADIEIGNEGNLRISAIPVGTKCTITAKVDAGYTVKLSRTTKDVPAVRSGTGPAASEEATLSFNQSSLNETVQAEVTEEEQPITGVKKIPNTWAFLLIGVPVLALPVLFKRKKKKS